MELKELLKFIEQEDARLKMYYGDSVSEKETVLARTIKISEEFGELCDAVLASVGLQRKEKLVTFDTKKLPQEFADVLFTTLLLAKTMDVDIEKGIRDKIKVVTDRYK